MLRAIRIPALGLMLASGCQCDIPFSETMTLTLQTDVGGSSTCAFNEEETATLDENGNAVSDGDFGEVHYNYAPGGGDPPTTCTVNVVSWRGTMADLAKVREDIDTSVEEQGLDPEKVTVTIDNVTFATVGLEVETAAGAPFPLENVGPYDAAMHIVGEEDEVRDVVVIANPGTGPVLEEHVTTTDDGAAVAAIFSAALDGGAEVIGTGEADVQFRYEDLATLTDNDEDAPVMTITVEVTVDGTLTAGL